MRFKKKGLEPLIATILLIVVAVILVTIVLAWGKNFTTEGLSQTQGVISNDCMGATISVSSCTYTVNGTDDVNGVSFLIRNTGDKFEFSANDFNVIAFSGNYIKEAAVTVGALDPGAISSASASIDDTEDALKAVDKIEVRSLTCPTVATDSTTCVKSS